MLVYTRQNFCECANYKDLETLNFQERQSIKNYWLRGYIYNDEKNASKECECHKQYRLTGRYNRFAKASGLLSFEDLQKLKYLGKDNCYTKLKGLPGLVKEKNLKDVLVFVTGAASSQKTTSLAKLAHQIILQDLDVVYISYSTLIEKLTNNYSEDYLNDLKSVDWLLIDDCFQSDTINFKNIYSKFYNLILYRKNPTILATRFSKEKILNSTDRAFYNRDLLESLFEKVERKNGILQFTDIVDSGTVRNVKDTINLWEN